MKNIIFIVLLTLILSMLISCSRLNSKQDTFAKWSNESNLIVPISVYNSANIKLFDKAITAWNSSKCKLFFKSQNIKTADVIVARSYESTYKNKKGKKVQIAGSWNKNGTITIYGNRFAIIEYAILIHELGHVLGLKHDYKIQSSIMRPGASSEYYTKQPPWPRPSSIDIKALRKKYCNR